MNTPPASVTTTTTVAIDHRLMMRMLHSRAGSIWPGWAGWAGWAGRTQASTARLPMLPALPVLPLPLVLPFLPFPPVLPNETARDRHRRPLRRRKRNGGARRRGAARLPPCRQRRDVPRRGLEGAAGRRAARQRRRGGRAGRAIGRRRDDAAQNARRDRPYAHGVPAVRSEGCRGHRYDRQERRRSCTGSDFSDPPLLAFFVIFGRGRIELPAVLVALDDFVARAQLFVVLVLHAERLSDVVDDVLIGRRIVASGRLFTREVRVLDVPVDVAA